MTTAYSLLIKDFLHLLGAGDSEVNDALGLEFEHDDLLVKICAHPNKQELLLDVAILKLDDDTPATLNAQRYHTLLQLNALARYNHGATAALTADNILTLGRTLPLASLDAPALLTHFNRLIELALELRQCWQNLGELLERASNPGTAQTQAAVAAVPFGNFA